MTRHEGMAFLELLESYEQAVERAAHTRKIACAIIDAYVAGLLIEDATIERFIAQAERGVAELRALVATHRHNLSCIDDAS